MTGPIISLAILAITLFGGKTRSQHTCNVANKRSSHRKTVSVDNYSKNSQSGSQSKLLWTKVIILQ